MTTRVCRFDLVGIPPLRFASNRSRFDIDANSIVNVPPRQGHGQRANHQNHRLLASEAEIQRMVKEGEANKEADQERKKRHSQHPGRQVYPWKNSEGPRGEGNRLDKETISPQWRKRRRSSTPAMGYLKKAAETITQASVRWPRPPQELQQLLRAVAYWPGRRQAVALKASASGKRATTSPTQTTKNCSAVLHGREAITTKRVLVKTPRPKS